VRYLLRRLRRAVPERAILVGLWPADAPAMQDERTRAAIGADRYVKSLQEAVETCLTLAPRSEPAGEPHAA